MNSGADAILRDIDAVRSAGAEVIVVSLNWGSAGKSAVTKKQQAFAQQLADAGVDVIVGTGNRIAQDVVWLSGKHPDGASKQTLCAYSLGGLVNESRKNGNVAAMLLQLKIACDGSGNVTFEQVSCTPTYIWRFKQDGRWYYRVVASDQPAPEGMEDDQIASMNRALQTIQKALGNDSAVTLRSN